LPSENLNTKMNKIFLPIIAVLSLCASSVCAQQKTYPKTSPNTAANSGYKVNPAKYTKYSDIVEYKLFSKGILPFLKEKDIIAIHSVQKCGDSILNSTYRDNKNEPVLEMVAPKKPNNDFTELFYQMGVGDSLVVHFNTDSVLTKGKPLYYHDGDELLLIIKVVRNLPQSEKDSLKADAEKRQEEAKIEQQLANAKHSQEMVEAGKLEDKEIETYCTQNKLKYKRTEEGLYYVITKEGKGANPPKGSKATVNYTGYFFKDNKKFDSNIDTSFGHVTPFEFTIGTGMVINGWDQGIPLLTPGAKAIFFLPSRIAYGERGFGEAIAPNTMLKYEVELVSFK
jgi:FKBP-type peptidyl-prolyl cis-trans isomerase FkpA